MLFQACYSSACLGLPLFDIQIKAKIKQKRSMLCAFSKRDLLFPNKAFRDCIICLCEQSPSVAKTSQFPSASQH